MKADEIKRHYLRLGKARNALAVAVTKAKLDPADPVGYSLGLAILNADNAVAQIYLALGSARRDEGAA